MKTRSIKTVMALGFGIVLMAILPGCPGGGDGDPAGDMSMAIGDPTKSVTNKGPVSYKVTYSGAKAVTLSENDVTLETTGTANGTISVIGSGVSSRTVTVSNITGDGTLGIAIKEGTANDGKAKPAVGGKSKRVTVDNTPPAISISSPSTGETGHGPVLYEITYGGADTITLSASDVVLNVTGNDARDIKVTSSGPNTRTVTISDIGGNGTLGISIAPGTAKDDAGNLAPAAGPSETFIVSNDGPSLAISAPSTDATNTGPVTYTITYSGADAITLSEADIVLNKTGTATGAVSVSTASATQRTVTVSDINGYYGDMGISVQSGTARDMVGNLAPSAGPSQTFEVYGPPPTLQPGNGFTEPTPQPDPIGEGPGADAKAIARWDVVPFQTFDGIFEIGVVAFHINGIDTVEFSLEGGPWTPAIPAMTPNPRTGVKEYWVKLDASLLPDGPCEIRAIAYPTVGIPRVLQGDLDVKANLDRGMHSMKLWANSGGTLREVIVHVDSVNGSNTTGDGSIGNPYQTPGKAAYAGGQVASANDSVTIRLAAGNYIIDSATAQTHLQKWTTVEPEPSLDASDVVITGEAGSLGLQSVRLHRLSIQGVMRLRFPRMWLDEVHFDGQNLDDGSSIITGTWSPLGRWVTGGTATGHRNVFRGATFYRGHRVIETSGSPFGSATCVLNSRCDAYVKTLFHGDVWHWLVSASDPDSDASDANAVLYDVVAENFTTQGIYAARYDAEPPVHFNNVAFVDVAISHPMIDGSDYRGGWWSVSTNHLLMKRVNAPTQVMRWNQADSGSTVSNVSISESTFYAFAKTPLPENTVFYNNSFTKPNLYGAFVPPDYQSPNSE